MSEQLTDGTPVQTVPQLLAHALAMETEAAERYGELADLMQTHRRTAVAQIFRRLAIAEKQHVVDLTAMCKDVALPHYAPWDFQWRSKESPETIDIGRVHYHLSVREALELALEHERKATQFYADVADAAQAPDVIALARQFADEERQHIGWLEDCLAECEPDDSRASEDPDPPLSQE